MGQPNEQKEERISSFLTFNTRANEQKNCNKSSVLEFVRVIVIVLLCV